MPETASFGRGSDTGIKCPAVLVLCLGIFAFQLSALDPGKTLTQYAHRIWGQEEGLFQPTIYSILQTRDGFLWLGTQDSLIRFDGAVFAISMLAERFNIASFEPC